MAELCRKCFEKDFGDLVDNKKVVMSKNKDLCESCGVFDHTVDRVNNKGFFDSLVEFSKRFGL